MNTLIKKLSPQYRFILSYISLICVSLVLFHRALSVTFFSDDFAFLELSKAKNLVELLSFFIPGKSYFYRPLPTELFYFSINISGRNAILAHIVVFITFSIGLYFLYKSLLEVSKNFTFSTIVIFLYAAHFTHVFQLYELATFQEVCLLTFLSISFFSYFRKKYFISIIFFICALLSKENAIMYPFFLLLFSFLFQRKELKKSMKLLIPFFILAGIFLVIYRQNLSHVTELELYKIRYSPKLIFNNLMWYVLWASGVPNVMPSYMTNIYKPPIPAFYDLFKSIYFRNYFYLFLLFWGTITAFSLYYLVTAKKKFSNILQLLLFVSFSFVVFILPALPILHKWMVRLTIPLFFISILQGFILMYMFNKSKILFCFVSLLYISFNIFGTVYHQESSLYFYESKIVNASKFYFTRNYNEIKKHKFIYFIDKPNEKNPMNTSEKLFTTFSDQSFLDYFFPGSNIKAVYNYKQKQIPADSYVVNSYDLLK